VVCTSGNGASRLGRLSRPLSTTSWPARANHSDASGMGVSATQPLTPRVCSSSRTRSHRSLAPPRSRRLPALRAAGRPRLGLTRVKDSRRALRWIRECLLTTRIACERHDSGASASAELRAIPTATPQRLRARCRPGRLCHRDRDRRRLLGILRSWPRSTRTVRRA
jgi:hypothetical protein